MNRFDLSGRVAIVTGGNGGLGLGMAKGLAEAGASIVIGARNAEKNAAAIAEIEALDVSAVAIECDLREKSACEDLVRDATNEFGRLDILVNNSGINYRRLPQDFEVDEWDEIIRINLTAAFHLSRAAYPHFVKAGGGKVINVGSMMSIFGSPTSVAYGASKGGIMQMTMSLACAWAPDNIQANAILPGWVDTPLTRQARQDIPSLHETVLDRTPASRWGKPEDFAGIATFLASQASDFVTGTAITVDGGFAARG